MLPTGLRNEDGRAFAAHRPQGAHFYEWVPVREGTIVEEADGLGLHVALPLTGWTHWSCADSSAIRRVTATLLIAWHRTHYGKALPQGAITALMALRRRAMVKWLDSLARALRGVE